jgi:hypothetical protein
MLEPLMAELGLSRQTIVGLSETIANLREERGQLRAELEAARLQIASLNASHSPVAPNLTAETSEPSPSILTVPRADSPRAER